MMTSMETLGRTIQLFLIDGSPSGLIVASIHGWTGSVLVSTQSTFDRLLARPEVDRTGIYILYGPDPEEALRARAYIGEADSVRDRIGDSAGARGFWETAVVITTSDGALTKGHVRYLEARLLEMAQRAGRVKLDNTQLPGADRRYLPEADRANMESFLGNLGVILPVIGLDLLKPQPQIASPAGTAATGDITSPVEAAPRFEIHHPSGIKAYAVEEEGEFVVLKGSQTLKDTDYAHNSYARLKQKLIDTGILRPTPTGDRYEFTAPYSFRSPSAAGSVILDRNTNGRTRWYVMGGNTTYHQWQEAKATAAAS
jgi:hypothetical protein